MTPRRRIPLRRGRQALATVTAAWHGGGWHDGGTPTQAEEADQGQTTSANNMATAVRYTLEELAAQVPGNSVEVRVPPYGVTQCIPGPTHTRGTPPNIVETDPQTWLELVTGATTWDKAVESGKVSATGTRAHLGAYLPLLSSDAPR